jgi:hypothetical protein
MSSDKKYLYMADFFNGIKIFDPLLVVQKEYPDIIPILHLIGISWNLADLFNSNYLVVT